MYTYTCCRCPNCTGQIVLEDRAESDTQVISQTSEATLRTRGLPILSCRVRDRELLRHGE